MQWRYVSGWSSNKILGHHLGLILDGWYHHQMLGSRLFKCCWLGGRNDIALSLVGWWWCRIAYDEMSTWHSTNFKVPSLGSVRRFPWGVVWVILVVDGHAQLTSSCRCCTTVWDVQEKKTSLVPWHYPYMQAHVEKRFKCINTYKSNIINGDEC